MLEAPPTDETLEVWLTRVAARYGRVLGGADGAARVTLASAGEARRTARLFVGEAQLAEAEITGSPLTAIAIGSRPTRTLELRWSRTSPLALHVVGEILPRRAYLEVRRFLTHGL